MLRPSGSGHLVRSLAVFAAIRRVGGGSSCATLHPRPGSVRALARATSIALLLALLSLVTAPIMADDAKATVQGRVVDERNALPIAGAAVTLARGGANVATTTTDSGGRFSIANVDPGTYDLAIRASGYSGSSSSNIVVTGGGTVNLNAALAASQASGAANFRTIGRVSTSANAALAAATTITQSISVENLARTGQLRVADQLGTLPALNVTTSSSPGDDVSVNIRGFGSTETATLLDGHPVGPLGVLAPDPFNYAATPLFGLNNVDVTYGSGAQGLYGSDTVAGAVNLSLLNPTRAPRFDFQQQVGGYGILSTSSDATGTIGKLGYALAAGVSGQYGSFHNVQVFQSARPNLIQGGSVTPPDACSNPNGNDVSACNQTASTYNVSQNTKLSSDMAKLRYDFSPATALQLSGYSVVQFADSTGNGDNDYLPVASRLGQIGGQTSDCTAAGGAPGYSVVTNPISNSTACYSAGQWAATSFGPNGGGQGRNRSTSMRDYDARFTTTAGANNISLDAYVNNYVYEKDSSLSGGVNASGQQLGTPVFSDYFNTHGYLISDDIASAKNDLAFGYSLLNQLQSSQNLVSVGDPPQLAFQSTYAPALFREGSFFIRDNHQFGDRFSLFANAWFKRSSVTAKSTFDPRISALIRPDSNDVFRLTYGRSDGAPAPLLKATGVVFQSNPGASLTNVTCGLNDLPNTVGNPKLENESANDFEAGYGHRFKGDSNIQLNAYVTNVSNRLTTASQPLLQYGVANVSFESTALQTYLSRLLNQGCLTKGASLTDVYKFLAVPTTLNIGHELARGIELSGRQRLNPVVYIDYGYYIESSQLSGITDPVLIANPTLVNGGQQLGIPLRQATFSIDVAPGPWEFRLDNYYVGANNPLNRPAYWNSNAFITRSLNRGKTLLTLGGTNVFNSAVQFYGLQGSAPVVAVNSFAPPGATGLDQFLSGANGAEEFGLTPPQLTFTLTQRL